MVLDNDIDDRDSGERARSTYSDSSIARRNGVVSPSDMVGNDGSTNQETSVELAGPVEDYDKEGDFTPDDYKYVTSEKYLEQTLPNLQVSPHHCEYQELKLAARAKGKQYNKNMYSSNHYHFNQVILS